MLIDTHAHLDLDPLCADVDAVLRRAIQADVHYIINIGISLESSAESISLAQKYPRVYATVGIHPHEASVVHSYEWLSKVEELMRKDKVVALGEVGLDYYRDIAKREDQRLLFRAFLELHKKSALPLVIHARDSYDDVYMLIDEIMGKAPVKGVMHCFSGDKEALRKALDRGLYISFTAPVTYKKNDQLRVLVEEVPDERLLLETDSPYLPPQSKRGKTNEPAFLRETAEYIAKIRKVNLDDLARITSRNAYTLFGVPEVDLTPKAVYKIRDSLYINTTKNCTNECIFCVKFFQDTVKGHTLSLTKDPTVEEVLAEIAKYKHDYKEVVFCGFGEPLLRLDFIKTVASDLKKSNTYIRIDTNGHGNLIYKRDITPELKGLVDEVCVSLNTENETLYEKLCQPKIEGNIYQGIKDFIVAAKGVIPNVVITCLDMPEVNVEAVKKIAHQLGVDFRLRHYNKVG